jgi:flagellar export protein FliJ
VKKYRFPLERVLGLRRMEADLARAQLEKQMGEVRKHEEMRREIARQAAESAAAARVDGVTGMELAGAENFRNYAARADTAVAAEHGKASIEANRLRQALMEAERKVKALETLDERRLSAWRRELSSEIEQFASEAFLARWKPQEQADPESDLDPKT